MYFSYKYGIQQDRKGFGQLPKATTGLRTRWYWSMTYRVSLPSTVYPTGCGKLRSMPVAKCSGCSWVKTKTIAYVLTRSKRFVILGNKIDREDREIPTMVGEDFASRHNMYYLETSAKEAENVERLFMKIADDLLQVGGNWWIIRNMLEKKLRLKVKLFGWNWSNSVLLTASKIKRSSTIWPLKCG